MDKESVMTELAKVIDPEIGVPITDMKLVDRVDIEGDTVEVDYHLTMPFCPPVFATQIGKDIRRRLQTLPAVKAVRV
ncbi:MAG: metal-sulfur cluster assembly factor, partial [Nitrososphaeria archaeon]